MSEPEPEFPPTAQSDLDQRLLQIVGPLEEETAQLEAKLQRVEREREALILQLRKVRRVIDAAKQAPTRPGRPRRKT